MPEILTYNTPPNVEKGKTKQSIFKSFFDFFNSKDKFTKLSLITFALIIIATPFIVANKQIFRPKAATTGDTLDLIVSDMTQPHMGCVKGTAGYDWQYGPVLQGVSPRGTHTAAWAMLDWDCQHDSGSPGIQIEVQDFRMYALINGRTWQEIANGIYGSQINDPNFGSAIYGDAGAGPIFNAPPHGKGIQFYQGFVTYPAGMTGAWARYKARLVNNDGQAFLIANVGADWATMNPFNDLGSMGVGRLKRLTSDWQWFNLSTVPESVLRANPPPGLDIVTIGSPTPTPTPPSAPTLTATPPSTPTLTATPTPLPSPTPLVVDTDRDGFTDKVEAYIGTDPNKVCGVNTWPPDVDNDGAVTILDMSTVSNVFLTKIGDLKYNKRYDMDADGAITILDMTTIASYFLQRCTTPVMAPLASRPDVNQFIAVTSKVIEAETFKLNSGYADPGKNIFSDTTASGGKGFILWSNGSAQTVTSNGFSKATFRVKADVCQGGPRLTIKIDGKILYSQDFVSTSWTDITVNFAAVAGTSHTILVELANDRYRAGICDRNLRFDKVTLL